MAARTRKLAVCLVALLMGPLSWEHYFVWASVPLVLCCDLELWLGRSRRELVALACALAVGTWLLTQPLQSLWSASNVPLVRARTVSPSTRSPARVRSRSL